MAQLLVSFLRRIREQTLYERKKVEKTKAKGFHRSSFAVKEQIIKLKDSEGKIV